MFFTKKRDNKKNIMIIFLAILLCLCDNKRVEAELSYNFTTKQITNGLSNEAKRNLQNNDKEDDDTKYYYNFDNERNSKTNNYSNNKINEEKITPTGDKNNEVKLNIGGLVEAQYLYVKQPSEYEADILPNGLQQSPAEIKNYSVVNGQNHVINVLGKIDVNPEFVHYKDTNKGRKKIITVGAKISQPFYNASKNTFPQLAPQEYIYVKTPYLQFQIGAVNSSASKMRVDAQKIASGAGGVYGAWWRYVSLPVFNTSGLSIQDANVLNAMSPVYILYPTLPNEAGFTTHTSAKFNHDIINNYFVYGPEGKNEWFQVDKNQSIYASGNMIDKNRDGVLNGGPTSIYWYQGEGTILNKPWNELTTKGPSGVLPYDDIDSLVWYQVGTLGKAGALVKSVSAMGLKTNNGWGEVIAGKAATDTDKDGMPDYFEEAMGYDSAKDDAMVKESDGYVRIEKYINWLGAMHAKVAGNGTLDFDLRSITRGFQDVKPAYSVLAAENGTVDLQKDGYTARFTPDKNFKGLASFKYTVKGNDNTEYTGRVEVLVEKVAGSGEQPRDTVSRDSSVSVADSTEKDSIPTRLTENFRLHGNLESMKVFDMNGNYMGSSTQNLPQGRYIVLQKIQGRTVNVVYIKH